MAPRWPFQPPQRPRAIELVPQYVRDATTACAAGCRPWPLLLIGDTGSGKTCAALCLLDHAGYGAYAEVGQLCEDLIAALDGRFLHYSILFYPTHVWNVWISANVTVLDEVGAREKVSDHHYNVVKKALDLREGKPSVVISNLTLEAISQVYDDRVASRMSCGTVVALTGDRRLEERS